MVAVAAPPPPRAPRPYPPCTVDTDCAVGMFCDCTTASAAADATTNPTTNPTVATAGGGDSPAAPRAHTPVASALSFFGMVLSACMQPSAAGACTCAYGERAVAPAANGTAGTAGNGTAGLPDAHGPGGKVQSAWRDAALAWQESHTM